MDTNFVGPKDNPWVQTWLGKKVELLDPKPESIDYRDIAHHLAGINRFTGATNRPYNVAQHSVFVARRAGVYDGRNYTKLPEARYGLMHDASEAYLGDVSSPLKHIIKALYMPLEENFMVTIAIKFGIEMTDEIEAAVKRADLEMCAAEARDNLGPPPEPWGMPYPPASTVVEPLIARQAECAWLIEFRKLFPECA